MASLTKRKGSGIWQIEYIDADGSRKCLYLGKCSKTSATSTQSKIAALVAAKCSGEPLPRSVAVWLADCGDKLRGKLERIGLIEERRTRTLKPFLEKYIADRSPKRKENTILKWKACQKRLLANFGDCELRTITPGAAEDWNVSMVNEGLAQVTIAKQVRIAKQFFQYAVDCQFVESNPFQKLNGNGYSDRSRQFFVSQEMIEQVIDAATDDEFRLVIALARYAGLRTPSETLELTWDDIDWQRGLMHVRSPKTEHIAGKESRIVPIYPELRRYLDALWESAPEGLYVIQRYRMTNVNLRTRLLKTIKRAGVKPWPKLFHNLRASFQTEQLDLNPFDLVCEIVGNSKPVAMKHYAMATRDRLMAMKSPNSTGKSTGETMRKRGKQQEREESETAV